MSNASFECSKKMSSAMYKEYKEGKLSGEDFKNATEHYILKALLRGTSNNPNIKSIHPVHRYLKPHYSNRFEVEQKEKNHEFEKTVLEATNLHQPNIKLATKYINPVIKVYNAAPVKGTINGDVHNRNTNPGYNRNASGGFYTS